MENDPGVDAFESKVAHLLRDLRSLDVVDEVLKQEADGRDPVGGDVLKRSP